MNNKMSLNQLFYSAGTYWDIPSFGFRLGFVPSLCGNGLYAFACSAFQFDDGSISPVILVSTDDFRTCITNESREFAEDFLTFIIGHEIGHLVDFAINPAEPGLVTDIEREAVADTYSLGVSNFSLIQYESFVNQACAEFARCWSKSIRTDLVARRIDSTTARISELRIPTNPSIRNFTIELIGIINQLTKGE